jgi:S-adenosylmethionine:tRNA ribosyltransferase-isomerase
MHLEDFDYQLPSELIAQQPAGTRDASRLLTLDRATGEIGEAVVSEIARYFRSGDILVVNDTKVIPARLTGRKETGGRAEVFLVRRMAQAEEVWTCLINSSKRPKPGSRIVLAEDMIATLLEAGAEGEWQVAFTPGLAFNDWLERNGQIPLPPYIRRSPELPDRDRYQTVFARHKGAVAAPTAGLHFTGELLEAIASKGVEIVSLTLHVGLGTFMPVRVALLNEHRMHREQYHIPIETSAAVNKGKCDGGRVIALGTTTARALEHATGSNGMVRAGDGEADLFIYPGYTFKAVDALITNFHLPKSTLLMLVSAFAGKDLLFMAYEEAVKRRFRFFSYGDAMFIF